MTKPRLVKIAGRWEVRNTNFSSQQRHSEIAIFWAAWQNGPLREGETRMEMLERILQVCSQFRELPATRKFYMQQCALKGHPPRRDLYPITPAEFMQVVREEWPEARPNFVNMRDALGHASIASNLATVGTVGRDFTPPINGEFAGPDVKRTWAYLKWIEIAGASRLQELHDYLAWKVKP